MPADLNEVTEVPEIAEGISSSYYCEKADLRPSPCFFEREEDNKCPPCQEYNRNWLGLSKLGIQPNMDGVQVYAWPQSPEKIRLLGETLVELAKKMGNRKNEMK